ncbi:MAG: hypothetical protein NZ772_14065 [Cyanobacteria bacterium]|nr:hypothetical protein [Cyanobacteriota bacterium]MDW8202520.1 hypothetical protein [Cyanobacteriota bacterium SKYGB_h_bin112]
MRTGAIVCLGLLMMWGLLATPLRAQRLGNSSLDFYEQGLQQLEREIQRLQVNPTLDDASLLTPIQPSAQPPSPQINATPPQTPSSPHLSPSPTVNSEPSPTVNPEQPSS